MTISVSCDEDRHEPATEPPNDDDPSDMGQGSSRHS